MNLIVGINSVLTLLKQRSEACIELYIVRDKENQEIQGIIGEAKKHGIPIIPVKAAKLDEVAKVHQGVGLRVKAKQILDENQVFDLLENKSTPLLLVLDNIQDPRNLGACLRTAEAAGVDVVIMPRRNSAPLSAVASKAASGALEILPIAQVGNLSQFLKRLQKAGVWIVGTSLNTKTSIYQLDLNKPLALVMGNEGKGMRQLSEKNCDELGYIPMQGCLGSLNVSVATGVCLFEAVRQRI